VSISNAVLALGILCIVWSLIRAHRDRRNWLDLTDLLRGEDGKLSRGAAVLLGSFGLMSWVIWKLSNAGTLTNEAFLGYGAIFATPAVVKLIVNATVERAKVTPPSAEASTVIGNSVTMTAPPAKTVTRARPSRSTQ
jgi:hypothetical protein